MLIETAVTILNENKQTEDFLNTDRIPTMEELREHFKTHDFTTSAVYDEEELTDEMKSDIAYVSCYSNNNPLIALRNKFGRVVSENVHKLVEEYPEQAEKIIEQYAYVFEQPEKADEFLKKGIDTAMEVMQFRDSIEEVQNNPAEEDFSSKPRNFPRMDFERKWYHTRAKVSVEPIEDIDEQGHWADDVEDVVFSNMRINEFWNSLSEDDRIILTHSMNGLTQKEIADKMGFADHSAVSKKLKKMKNMFLSMDK